MLVVNSGGVAAVTKTRGMRISAMLAGDAAAWDGERGLLPSDLLPHVRRLANP